MMPPSSNPYCLAGGACFALAGAAFDLRWRRIPNRLTGAAVLIGLASNTWNDGMGGLLSALAACLLTGAVFSILFFMGGMGGGDVKLMAAIATFAGLPHLPALLLATALAGGVFAIAVSAAYGRLGATLGSAFGWLWPFGHKTAEESPQRIRLYLPYGVPIAVGALFTLYSGVLGL
jgi:prepilin peptidase CpaA